jgi:hypothetical protein
LMVEHTFDSDVEQFNSKVVYTIRAAAEATVSQTGCHTRNRAKPLPYWNDEIRAAIYQRNRPETNSNGLGCWVTASRAND